MKKQQGFTLLGNIMPTVINKYKLETALSRHQVLKCWETVVQEFVKEAKNQTKAMDFKNGVLTVACLSKELAYEIKVLAKRIAYMLNKILGRQLVYEIHIEI